MCPVQLARTMAGRAIALLFMSVWISGLSGQLSDTLDGVDKQLIRLTAQTQQLADAVKDAVDYGSESEFTIKQLHLRMDRYSGAEFCKPGFFQCGRDSQKCVSNIFVCDGVDDCPNAEDETKGICDFPFKSGITIVQTYAEYSRCESISRIIRDSWIVRQSSSVDWFPSFPWAAWNYQAEVSDAVSDGKVMMLGKGRYRYATSELLLPFLVGGYRIGTCWVERVSPERNRLHCYVYRARIPEPCMYAIYDFQ